MISIIKHVNEQSRSEELLNGSAHFFGALLSIAGLYFLLHTALHTGNPTMILSAAIYGSSLIIMYLASGLYHLATQATVKKKLKVLDHCSIYILIAGSYTPFLLISIAGRWGWSIFGIIWILAIMGVTFKLFTTGKFSRLSTAIYLLMGWLSLTLIHPLIHSLALGGIMWLVFGGLSYTLGVVFYVFDSKYNFSHFIWHIAVLAGSICQYIAIAQYVMR